MYLIFTESMILPEVAERREDDDFEDWLTAALIENTNQQHLNGVDASSGAITDLWMLEIAERTGKVWRGRFHVEFNREDQEPATNGNTLEQGTGVLSFSLDIDTGEMRVTPKAGSSGGERKRSVRAFRGKALNGFLSEPTGTRV